MARKIVAPVIYDPRYHPRYEGLQFSVIKELRKGAINFGITSPYTTNQLGSVMASYTLTPRDCKTLMQLILTGTQYDLWQSAWHRLAEEKHQHYQNLPPADPAAVLPFNALAGKGEWHDHARQAREIQWHVLDDVKDLALFC